MEPELLAAYLDAATAVHGLSLTVEQRARALVQFERFALIAEPLLTMPLHPSDEPILGPLP